MTISEKAFQDQVISLATKMGLLTYHTHDSRRSVPGFPDLVIVGARAVLWRELKTDKGRLSKDQEHWIRVLNDAGQDAGVWRPSEHWPHAIQDQLRGLGRLRQPYPAVDEKAVRADLAKRVSGTEYFPPSS